MPFTRSQQVQQNSTPVTSTSTEKKRNRPSPEVHNTPNKLYKTQIESDECEKMSNMEEKIDKLQEQFSEFMKMQQNTHAIVMEQSIKLTNLAADVNQLKEDHKLSKKRFAKVDKEIASLSSSVDLLSAANNKLQQQALYRDVILSGLPMLQKKDIIPVISSLGLQIGVPLNEGDIADAYSIASKNKDRAITIVKFHTEKTKRDVMTAYRNKKPILIEDIVRLGSDDKRRGSEIYINSNLTLHNRELKSAARKELTVLKYVWEKDGRILIREADNTRIIEITSIKQLNEIVQSIRYPARDTTMQNDDDDSDDDAAAGFS